MQSLWLLLWIWSEVRDVHGTLDQPIVDSKNTSKVSQSVGGVELFRLVYESSYEGQKVTIAQPSVDQVKSLVYNKTSHTKRYLRLHCFLLDLPATLRLAGCYKTPHYNSLSSLLSTGLCNVATLLNPKSNNTTNFDTNSQSPWPHPAAATPAAIAKEIYFSTQKT
jgi:hypothetical protein